MKSNINKILCLIPAFLIVLSGCNKQPELYTLAVPDDQMKVTPSATDVVLLQENALEEAVSFTWGEATDRGEGTKIVYYFRLYQTMNPENATELVKVEGERKVTWQVAHLNELLISWGLLPGDTHSVTAEVIAQVPVSSVYMKPELSFAEFNVTTYKKANSLYLVMGEGESGRIFPMTGSVADENVYTYRGILPAGSFKFVTTVTDTNAYYDDGEGSLSYGEDGVLFENTSDYISIEVNVSDYTVSFSYDAPKSLYIFAVGESSPVWVLERQEGDVLWYFGNLTEGLSKSIYASFNEDGSNPFTVGTGDEISIITDPTKEAYLVPEAWSTYLGYDCATASVVLGEEYDRFIVRNLFIPYSHGDDGYYNPEFPMGYMFPFGDCIADAAYNWDFGSSWDAFINQDRYAKQIDKMLRPWVLGITCEFKEAGEGFRMCGNWDTSGHVYFYAKQNGIDPIYEGTDPEGGWTDMDWWCDDKKWKPSKTGTWTIEMDVWNIRLRMVRPAVE